jgi:acyl-CoA reductase-like NAD-dependent aldehyde dehydrogenase
LHRELALTLERARTRLAVAMASETKSNPPDRWQHCLETADRARRFMKKLRRADSDGLQEEQGWIPALEKLKYLPAHNKTLRHC